MFNIYLLFCPLSSPLPGPLSQPDLFPSRRQVFRKLRRRRCDRSPHAQRGHQAAACQLPRSGEGVQRLCDRFHHRISQEKTTFLPLLSLPCKQQKKPSVQSKNTLKPRGAISEVIEV